MAAVMSLSLVTSLPALELEAGPFQACYPCTRLGGIRSLMPYIYYTHIIINGCELLGETEHVRETRKARYSRRR